MSFALKCTRDKNSVFAACYASSLLRRHTANNVFKVGNMKVEWIRTMEGRFIDLKYDNGEGMCWTDAVTDAVGDGEWKRVCEEKTIGETPDVQG